MDEDLIIEGSPEDLEGLRVMLEREFGPDAAVQPVTSAQSGQLREPVLIALVIALGGPVLTRKIAEVIRGYWSHSERMQELDNQHSATQLDHEYRMALVGDDDEERPVTLEQLASGLS